MHKPLIKPKPVHILLAEDDADDRELFIEAFSIVDPAIKVATVENGEKLMDHLKKTENFPDCIFLDLNMPKKNGKECLLEIKKNERMQYIPIIIYTTSVNSKDIDETYDRGASCFMRKPNSFKELTRLLDTYISSAFSPSPPRMIKRNFVLNAR